MLLSTVEPRYNDTIFSAISLRYTEVSFNQGSRAHIINKEGLKIYKEPLNPHASLLVKNPLRALNKPALPFQPSSK